MAKRRIPEQDIAEWVLRKQKGQSFRSIAKSYDVDARTVQAWVKRAGEEKEREHWEAVSRQVDVARLDEHYRLLLQAAVSLLQAARTDPLSTSPQRGAGGIVDEEMLSGARQAADILKNRGLDLSAPQKLSPKHVDTGESPALRLGRKLLQALFDHEPALEAAFKEWASHWASFQRERQALIETAGNLLRQKRVPGATSDGLKAGLVREALRKELLGNEARRSRVEPRNGGRAALVRYGEKTKEPLLTGFKADMESAAGAYDQILTQVSHQERIRPVKEGYQAVLESMKRVEELVDQLILVGRPQGHCPLCPQYAGPPGASGMKRVKPGGRRAQEG